MNMIKSLREKAGLSQTELARICGVHQTAVSQWENGRTKPDTDSLTKLADFFDTGISALLGVNSRTAVPVLGSVRAGLPHDVFENVLGYEEISQSLASQGDFFALVVEGESMLPRICPGDVVVVRRQDDVDNGDIAVVLVGESESTIKKVVKNNGGVVLVPNNSSYAPIPYSNAEIESLPVSILGKVVELRGRM